MYLLRLCFLLIFRSTSDELRSSGGRYDSVCPSPKSDDDDSDEANIQIKLQTSKPDRFTTLPRTSKFLIVFDQNYKT